MAKICEICSKEFEINNKYSSHQKLCNRPECLKERRKRWGNKHYNENKEKYHKLHHEYHRDNRDKILKQKKKYYDGVNNLDYRLKERWRFSNRPGSLDDYRKFFYEMREKQGDRCAICNVSFNDLRDIKIDHCHKTNKLRGLLCDSCNNGLGRFKDSSKSLRSAIDYLNSA